MSLIDPKRSCSEPPHFQQRETCSTIRVRTWPALVCFPKPDIEPSPRAGYVSLLMTIRRAGAYSLSTLLVPCWGLSTNSIYDAVKAQNERLLGSSIKPESLTLDEFVALLAIGNTSRVTDPPAVISAEHSARLVDLGYTLHHSALYQGCSLHHSGHLTLWGVRVAFTMVR
jgi:hypothetical protein